MKPLPARYPQLCLGSFIAMYMLAQPDRMTIALAKKDGYV